ncbi:MAG: DUF975 family protein [Lachnospiraceae bacterium]|nr:DUF975 family protein [Lachnospiraceae bacterium]
MEYYDSGALKRAAREKMATQNGTVLGAYLLQILILFGVILIVAMALAGTILQPMLSLMSQADAASDPFALQQQLMEQMSRPSNLVISQLISALIGALAATLTTGFSYICLKVSRGQKATVGDLFYVYRHNPDRVILLYLLIFVIQTIISAPADVLSYFSQKSPQNTLLYLLQLVFSIASFVISYIFSLMVSQAFFLYLDDSEAPVLSNFRESIDMMKGHKGRLFYLQVTFIGWILLSLLTCGILLIFVGPYMETAYAEFYRNLKHEPLYPAPEQPREGMLL